MNSPDRASIKIRPARIDDAEGIGKVHVDSWRSTYRDIVPDEVLNRLSVETRAAKWREIIGAAGSSDHTFVAVDSDERIIGFANSGANRSKEFPFKGELNAIYLHEEFQGQGIGRRLFDESIAALGGDGFVDALIWVLEQNPACRFYERMGAKACGEKMETMGGKPLKEVAYGWTKNSGNVSTGQTQQS